MINIKSYNNLYEQMISDENIKLAIMRAAKNKRKNNKRHRKLRQIRNEMDKYIPIVRGWIIEYLDRDIQHKPIEINDGISAKKRTIIVPCVAEMLVHHAIVNVLKPILIQGMYEHSYASIPGRGLFLDFLGFKFYRNHVGLRGKIALKAQRKAKRISKKPRANVMDARQMIVYAGFMKYADCYDWFHDHISPYVSIKQMREIVSRYDSRQATKQTKKKKEKHKTNNDNKGVIVNECVV